MRGGRGVGRGHPDDLIGARDLVGNWRTAFAIVLANGVRLLISNGEDWIKRGNRVTVVSWRWDGGNWSVCIWRIEDGILLVPRHRGEWLRCMRRMTKRNAVIGRIRLIDVTAMI